MIVTIQNANLIFKKDSKNACIPRNNCLFKSLIIQLDWHPSPSCKLKEGVLSNFHTLYLQFVIFLNLPGERESYGWIKEFSMSNISLLMKAYIMIVVGNVTSLWTLCLDAGWSVGWTVDLSVTTSLKRGKLHFHAPIGALV